MEYNLDLDSDLDLDLDSDLDLDLDSDLKDRPQVLDHLLSLEEQEELIHLQYLRHWSGLAFRTSLRFTV